MTKKTYPLSALTKAAYGYTGAPATTMRLLRKLGIKPVSEVKTEKNTYRAFDQAAMDKVKAYRAEKLQADAVLKPDPTLVVQPTPAAPPDTALRDAVAQLNKDLRAAFEYLNTNQASLHARLDRINATLTQLLDVATAPKSDVLVRAINGAKDDAGAH